MVKKYTKKSIENIMKDLLWLRDNGNSENKKANKLVLNQVKNVLNSTKNNSLGLFNGLSGFFNKYSLKNINSKINVLGGDTKEALRVTENFHRLLISDKTNEDVIKALRYSDLNDIKEILKKENGNKRKQLAKIFFEQLKNNNNFRSHVSKTISDMWKKARSENEKLTPEEFIGREIDGVFSDFHKSIQGAEGHLMYKGPSGLMATLLYDLFKSAVDFTLYQAGIDVKPFEKPEKSNSNLIPIKM